MNLRMSELRDVIRDRQSRLAAAPFLRALESSDSLAEMRAFAPQLYFYVFAFQDMLRLSHERFTDSTLRKIAGRHRAEDAGHQAWFANDAEALGFTRDVVWVFGDEHRPTRDFSYQMISEILDASDDRIRLLFPLILEAAGALFFPRIVDLIRRSGYEGQLQYFARSHQEVEANHEMFTESSDRELDEIGFDAPSFAVALDVIHRCFDACERMVAHLERHRLGATR
jgi:hypothetical protein